MYDIIVSIIQHAWEQGDSAQQYIYYICGALIIILSVTFIDLFYRLIRGIFRKGDF